MFEYSCCQAIFNAQIQLNIAHNSFNIHAVRPSLTQTDNSLIFQFLLLLFGLDIRHMMRILNVLLVDLSLQEATTHQYTQGDFIYMYLTVKV